MRKKKRLISLLLAVFIAVACLPAGIARADKAAIREKLEIYLLVP